TTRYLDSFPTRRSSDLKPKDVVEYTSRSRMDAAAGVDSGEVCEHENNARQMRRIPAYDFERPHQLCMGTRREQSISIFLEQGTRSEEHTSELQSLAYLV